MCPESLWPEGSSYPFSSWHRDVLMTAEQGQLTNLSGSRALLLDPLTTEEASGTSLPLDVHPLSLFPRVLLLREAHVKHSVPPSLLSHWHCEKHRFHKEGGHSSFLVPWKSFAAHALAVE